MKDWQKTTLVVIVTLAGGLYLWTQRNIPHALVANVPPTDLVATATLDTPQPTYGTITVTTPTPGAEIAAVVGLSHVPFVLAFNRLDAGHIRINTAITIPPTLTDWDALSPFPHHLDVAQDIPKLMLVSQRIQAIGAYEHGTLVRWMVTSTGKADTPTPSKLYFTNWKGKLVVSSIRDEWIMPWYFNLDNAEGVSMHQYDLPGYPASHSCVRMSESDAMWVYDWAQQWIVSSDEQTVLAQGTPVIVFGEYAYGKTAPWKKLVTDPEATTLTDKELTDIITTNLPAITAAVATRAQIETPSTSE